MCASYKKIQKESSISCAFIYLVNLCFSLFKKCTIHACKQIACISLRYSFADFVRLGGRGCTGGWRRGRSPSTGGRGPRSGSSASAALPNQRRRGGKPGDGGGGTTCTPCSAGRDPTHKRRRGWQDERWGTRTAGCSSRGVWAVNPLLNDLHGGLMELPGLLHLLRFLRDQRSVGIELQGTAALKAGGQKAEKKKYLNAPHILLHC